ncbi:hypothetical protein [Halovivax gelatinilyticus]|uniref:hypothetical protein n=1 Tax=Halovivax gelatinilyticus TaxID=2961597 RepID=UPI0020CA4037|nr:hypothetical protein [Halovivax gelatinilyticus]
MTWKARVDQLQYTSENARISKQDDAADNDVPVIDEAEFRALLDERGIDVA